MTWRDLPITDKQKEFIADIMEFSAYNPPCFKGTTRGEASDYIDAHAKEITENDPNHFGFVYS